MKKTKRKVFADTKAKRILALQPSAVGQEFSALTRQDEPVGVVACLCIDGPLAQNDNGWFESYESIVARFTAVMAEPSVQAVILKFNSPGGDVAGLFEAAKTMTAVKVASGKPVVAYVDEACYSAAYALAMVADELYMPAAAGCGSIGVITCMVDVSEANAEAGVRVEVITSGDQKADGHPDVPLSDDAIERTQGRVDDLAAMFFDLVGQSRGIPAATVESYEAGIFQGQDAVDARLADGIMSWADLVSAISSSTSTTKETSMAGSKLQAIREENEKAAALAASASTAAEVKFKHTKKSVEVIESEDEPSSSKGDDDEGGEEEGDDEKEKDDDAKKTSKKALLAIVAKLTGTRDPEAQMGALLALGSAKSREKSALEMVKELKAEREAEVVASMIDGGVKAGKILPSQRAMMASLPKASLKAYLAATPAMVRSISEESSEPKNTPANERKVTAAMAKMWKSQGIKEALFPQCLANMTPEVYASLENK